MGEDARLQARFHEGDPPRTVDKLGFNAIYSTLKRSAVQQ